MSEKEIILARVQEKQKLRKARRDISRMLLFAIGLGFLTLFTKWLSKQIGAFYIPVIFQWNSITLILSLISVWNVQKFIKKDELQKAYRFTVIALLAGILFLAFQIIGLIKLSEQSDFWHNLLFPFTFIHSAHLIVGLFLFTRILAKLGNFSIHSRNDQYAISSIYFWYLIAAAWLGFIICGSWGS